MNSYNELRKRLTTSGYPWNLVKPGVHERWELPNGSVFILARGASSNGHARQNYLKQIERAERAYTESLSGMAVNSPAPVPLPMVFEEVEPTPMSVVKVPAGPMPEPFSCRIGDEDVNAVNARGLHAALGVGRDFSNWIKDQITRARLVEHRDFERLAENGEQCFQGVTSRIEYALSLDAAKHVAMMAGTDKGFEVRDYFIKCEKKLSHVINTYLNMSKEDLFLEMSILAGDLAKEKKGREQDRQTIACKEEEIQVLTGVAEEVSSQLELIAAAPIGSLCLAEAAKHLKVSPRWFNDWLREIHWIYRSPLGTPLAFQDRINAGWVTHVIREYDTAPVYKMVVITPAGLVKLAEMLGKRTVA